MCKKPLDIRIHQRGLCSIIAPMYKSHCYLPEMHHSMNAYAFVPVHYFPAYVNFFLWHSAPVSYVCKTISFAMKQK